MNVKPTITTRSRRRFIRNVRKNTLLFMLVIMIISTVGCSSTEKKAENNNDQIKAVKAIKVSEEENPISLNYIGTIDSKELIKYSFKVSGQIKTIFVEEGDQVNKGDRLAQLDTTDLEFQLAAAKATMDTAEVNISKARDAADYADSLSERTDNLYKNGAVSKDAFDQVQLKKSTTESEYLQAKSQYAAARTDYNYKSDLLNNSAIYAQQDGYIAQKICNENERVGAYTPVIIVRSGSQIVNIGIPQQELAQIKLGFSAEVIVDEETAQGIITSISELPDTSTHTYKAEISIPDKTFRLGSIAKVSVNIGDQQGIWIPLTAIFSDDGENCVYVVKNQRAFKRTITIQNIHEDQARVSKLKNGEILIISGMNNLDDGTRVKVQKQE